MTSREELIEYFDRIIARTKQLFTKMEAEEKTTQYQEEWKQLQEKDRRRNTGFEERGENWRDIHIA